MTARRKTEFFYLGPPKTASTWLHFCLKDHPEISAPVKDETGFFDMFSAYGEDWYNALYPAENPGVRVDCTPTFLHNRSALEKILTYNPEAKFAFGLRNPVDRAFSYYWHIKKTGLVRFTFDHSFFAYNAWQIWIQPGYIAENIAFLKNHVPPDRLHWFFFEDLRTDKLRIVQDIYRFIAVKQDFDPQSLNEKINVAGARRTLPDRIKGKVVRVCFRDESSAPAWLSGKSEYRKGLSPEQREKLLALYKDEIARLEEILETDLSRWTKGSA